MDFSGTLNRLQTERGETNYKLAKAIGVHQTSIKNWKSGIKPHPKHVRSLERHFCLKEGTLAKAVKEGE